jgi:hypothetical protein
LTYNAYLLPLLVIEYERTQQRERERERERQTPERKREPEAMAALLSLVESASKEISEIA